MHKHRHPNRIAAFGITAGTAVLLSGAALADAAPDRYYGHYGMMGGGGGWIFGPIMMLLFFALLVGAVVLIVRLIGTGSITGSGGNGHSGDEAIAILRKRFARGEISAEEFEAARKTLESGGA